MHFVTYIVLLSFVFGCSSSNSSPDASTMDVVEPCSGSDALVLAAATVGPENAVPRGEQVLVENGFWFVLVNARCEYWVRQDRYSDVVSGVLTAERFTQFENDIWSPEIQAHAGTFRTGGSALTEFRVQDGRRQLSCQDPCDDGPIPAVVRDAKVAAIQWRSALFEEGRPLEGPVRLVVLDASDRVVDDSIVSAWELSTPADSYARPIDAEVGFGEGTLIDGESATILRELRRNRTSELGLFVRDRGVLFELFIRDVTPFEDVDGLFTAL